MRILPAGNKALIYPIYQNTHMKKTFALLALAALAARRRRA